MKYKLIGLSALVLMLLAVVLLSNTDADEHSSRYHQHLSAPQPDEACDCDGSELCTHLPIIRIETGGQYIPGEIIRDPEDEETTLGFTTAADGSQDILVTIETVEAEGRWHHASDPADKSSLARFRIRGNSSRNFPKKSWRIKLVQDESGLEGNDISLLGMEPDNDWALHGPFLDKTLLRNYMWMNISAEIMGYAPNVRFCEVILDGEYQGVYLLMETIKESDYRVNLSDFEAGAGEYSYLLEMDGLTEAEFQGAEGDAVAESYTLYTHQMEFDEKSTTMFCILYPQT